MSRLSYEDVLRVMEEERRAAQRLVEELLGAGAAAMLEGLPDYRAFGRHVSFYVRAPGCTGCVDAERLVKGFEALFGAKPRVNRTEQSGWVYITLEAGEVVLGITCVSEYRGCQIYLRDRTGAYSCKMTCYGPDRLTAVRLALLLAYSNVPPEYGHPYWSAETG